MSLRETIIEVMSAVIPITIVILVLKIILLDVSLKMLFVFMIGIILTILGFFLFMIGAKKSLLPIGELIGISIMKKSKVWFIVVFGVLIGIAVTVAEPGVQVLTEQITNVASGTVSKLILISVISLGVGIFLGIGMLRVVFKIPLQIIIVSGYILIFLLTFFSSPEFIGFAFDAGGVTTGVMTVPFILALGIGMASVKGTKKTSHENFGFIALASIGPIIAMLILGVIVTWF